MVGTRSVAAALGHDRPLIEAEGGGYGGVFDMLGFDASLEKGVGHVELTPDAALRAVG